MRIAIFTDTYLPDRNGISTSIEHFTELMAADGHEIMIFCPKNGRYKDKKHTKIKVKRYLSITTPSYKDIKLAMPFIWTAMHDLKEFNPEVVHIQTPLGIGWIGIWASKMLKLKSIQTYHTYIPDFLRYVNPKTLLGLNRVVEYVNSTKIKYLLKREKNTIIDNEKEDYESLVRRVIGQFAKEKTTSKKDSTNLSKKFNDRFGRDYTRVVYNRADLVLTPSHSMRSVLIKQGVKSPVEVLSNGINYDFFKKKTDYHIKNRIIYIGRLGYEKSVDVVIKAFDIVAKGDKKVVLEVFGDGPAKVSLINLAKELGIAKRIKFHGSYDINKLASKLHEYDFLVTASAIETQGIVILEAMASGLPVIGVNKLAVPEVVLDGKNGYISEPGDHYGMARNIIKLLDNDEKLKRFGQKSLEIAKTHEVVDCKNRLVEIYGRMRNNPS